MRARIMKNLSKICRCEVEICATKFAVLLNEILAYPKGRGGAPGRTAPRSASPESADRTLGSWITIGEQQDKDNI